MHRTRWLQQQELSEQRKGGEICVFVQQLLWKGELCHWCTRVVTEQPAEEGLCPKAACVLPWTCLCVVPGMERLQISSINCSGELLAWPCLPTLFCSIIVSLQC